MTPMHCLMLTLFTVILIFLVELTTIFDELGASWNEAGEPLFLTTFIEDGALEEARNLAKVVSFGTRDVESYSGYFTVNKEYDSNIFFWFFPALIDSEHAPVLLWLQGCLGVSSLLGLFVENGPFVVNQNQTLDLREYSWHVNHNIVYMDSPVGTGYSFTDDNRGFATNSTTAGHQLYSALEQFFTLFPLSTNEFYIVGESYAGKFIPALAKIIKDNSDKASVKMNLQGLAIGSGLIDPYHQINYGDYLYQIGLIDSNGLEEFKQLEDQAKHFIEQEEWQQAYDTMNQLMGGDGITSLFQNLTGFDFNCNYLNSSEPIGSTWFVDYVQKPDVRKALHVGNVVFNSENNLVRESLKLDIPKSTTAYDIPELLEYYKLLIYNGQLDVMTTFPQISEFLEHLAWSGAEEFEHAERKEWWVEEEFAGYVKSARNLTEVFVRNAGRRLGTDQPKWAWNLITRFTHRESF